MLVWKLLVYHTNQFFSEQKKPLKINLRPQLRPHFLLILYYIAVYSYLYKYYLSTTKALRD